MSTIPQKSKLDSYVDMGLLISKRHPDLPLTIYNYSQLTVMDQLWNSVTIACRGLVVDDKGRCVIRCMPKFFNSGELHAYTFQNDQAATAAFDDFYYTDKLDGSLIQMVNDPEYGFIVTSKGSFESQQAEWAKEIYLKHFDPEHLDSDKSYICELIHPENRIVLDYGDKQELRLITVIETETGVEKWDIWSRTWSSFIEPVNRVTDFEKHMEELNEGVVAVYPGGHRVKHKTEEYVRLHRIVTGFTPKRVWEALKEGDNLEFHNMPEEFDAWLEETKTEFIRKFNDIKTLAEKTAQGFESYSDKEVGLAPIDGKIKGLIFMLRNGKDIEPKIWGMIKP